MSGPTFPSPSSLASPYCLADASKNWLPRWHHPCFISHLYEIPRKAFTWWYKSHRRHPNLHHSLSSHPYVRSLLLGAALVNPPTVHCCLSWAPPGSTLSPYKTCFWAFLHGLAQGSFFLVPLTSPHCISGLWTLSICIDLCQFHRNRALSGFSVQDQYRVL